MKDKILSAVEAGDTAELEKMLNTENYGQSDLDLALGGIAPLIEVDLREAKRAGVDIKYTKGKVVAIATLLLDAKASPDARVLSPDDESDISSLLTFAVKIGYGRLVQLLIEKKADVNEGNPDLIGTALTWGARGTAKSKALMAGRLFVANPLLLWERETDGSEFCIFKVIQMAIEQKENHALLKFLKALNAFYISEKISHPFVLPMLLEFFVLGVAKIILSYNLDNEIIEKEIRGAPAGFKVEPLPLDELCEFPLIVAASKGDIKEVKQLLEAKADPTVSIKGNTALIWAIHAGHAGSSPEHTQIAKLLLESSCPAAILGKPA